LPERTRSTAAPRCVLEQKFCEDHVVSGGEASGAAAKSHREKRTAAIRADFGELDCRGSPPPPPKRTRALIVANSSCTRSEVRRQ
ncbi:unnamed protein product, partial [Laminaria digitata]